MPVYLAFGVDFNNVGNSDERTPMKSLCDGWNKRLPTAEGLEVIGYFGHAGNFVLRALGDNVEQISEVLRRASSERFAVFEQAHFQLWLKAVERNLVSPRPPTDGRRWTPGMVMDTNPDGGVSPKPIDVTPVYFASLADARIRLTWRNDLLVPGRNVLDRSKREGGWGGVATVMQRHAGGSWTARALRTVIGLVRASNASRGERL